MNQIDALIRFGYALVIITMFLMIWASLAGARELESNKHPPCLFSPLCTCSKASPNDLGIMQCKNVPYPAIPKTLNNSKVFMLQMERTGLQNLQPSFLQGTGLYRIEISHNPLGEVLEGAFDGLERTLWELSLHHNQLVEVPSRALRNLKKLKYLDLSGNQIDCIELDSFAGLENSLERLILADNSIDNLPRDAFSSLPKLDTIDLSGNNIAYLDPNIFQDGMANLAKLLLSNNVLSDVPCDALANLKNLRVLDLSHNVIKSVRVENDTTTSRLTLDVLHLEFNQIEDIPTASFSHFDVVNVTYLDGNPLKTLGERAFESARIRELYIRHCGLSFISPASFDGLGKTLQILDISGNNVTALPKEFLRGFSEFKALNIKDNKLKDTQTNDDVFAAIQSTIEKFDMSGRGNAAVNLKSFNKMKSIRSLSLGKLSTTQLSPEDFTDFGVELEDLKLTRSSIDKIRSHAFKHVRGVRRLDLSENQIGSIDNEAFTEIGHSLTSLKISHGFSDSFTAFPAQSFRALTSLEQLDLTNNHLKIISDTSFHFLQNLRTVELNDNEIERISKGTFQGDIHTKLETLALHFNNIKKIEENTFVDLKELSLVQLDDNRVTLIERRAFMNLNKLKYLTLRGNKLETISDEAFQIVGNDPLPSRICIQCEKDVNIFFMKIKRYQTLEKKWRDCVENVDPTNPYLEFQRNHSDEVAQLREKVAAYSIEQSNIAELLAIPDPLEATVENINQSNRAVSVNGIAAADIDDDFDRQLSIKKEKERKQRMLRNRHMAGYRSRRNKRKRKGANSGDVTMPLNLANVSATNDDIIPKMNVPYKRHRSDILEIISNNEVYEKRTRKNRRTLQPFDYDSISSKPQAISRKGRSLPASSPKKDTKSKEVIWSSSQAKTRRDETLLLQTTTTTTTKTTKTIATATGNTEADTSTSIKPRSRRRINYSEELVDEAFMYEQILHDKQKQQEKYKKSIMKVSQTSNEQIATANNLDVRLRLLEQRKEISIMPVKTRLSISKDVSMIDPRIPRPIKIKSEPLYNITSSVSVHIKPKAAETQTSSTIQISNITSLHSNRETPPNKRQKISCKYCTKIVSDVKQLAIHEANFHLKVKLQRVDAVKILHPKLRRGRMLNLDSEQYIRCVNCWLLHANNKSILDHWNGGACLFYCSICRKSFHDNIHELKPHFEAEHGIKFRAIIAPAPASDSGLTSASASASALTAAPAPAPVQTQAQTQSTEQNTTELGSSTVELNEYRCEPCDRIFKNIKAYRTHYTLIHKKMHYKLKAKKNESVKTVASASKHQKTIIKKWKKQTNEAVMKTIIRKPQMKSIAGQTAKYLVPKPLSPPPLQPARRKLIEPNTTEQIETVTRCDAPDTAVQEAESSQDQTVSTTYFPAPVTDHLNDLQIKPEPVATDEYTNNYADALDQPICNDWTPLQYNGWPQSNAVDPFIDISPRLKVKDINDLQDPKQRYPNESLAYQVNTLEKEQPIIMPNQNIAGLQIQNVQSYSTHSVQSQGYIDYSCTNNMNVNGNANMNMPGHGMCTSNLYITQGQPAPTTQLINPIYLLPTNSAIQDYHY